jgi:hypothetical protein
MSMETAVTLALAMGRILVLPPRQGIYLLNKDKDTKNNRFTFKDFFHLDSIAQELDPGRKAGGKAGSVAESIISFEEFLKREAVTGKLVDKHTGQTSFLPGNKTNWGGQQRSRGHPINEWVRSIAATPKWAFDDCMVGFPSKPGAGGGERMMQLFEQASDKGVSPQSRMRSYINNPTLVDGPAQDRLREMKAARDNVCVYDEKMQNVKVIHFMGDNASGARLLVHFYAFLFFEDWHHDLWTKRFVRDHLRYLDEIQCAAARIVNAMRQHARDNGNPSGEFDTFHIRRGDFQYKQTRISADEIYANVKDILVEKSTIFIATDERNKTFFEPLHKHYHVYFLDNFSNLVPGLNANYFGMLDQLVASRGRTFVGAYYSTFTGLINRLRGYHSQKDKAPGYEMGITNSYYYTSAEHKDHQRSYMSLHNPMWGREFPVGWRDIDHDLKPEQLV